MEGCLFWEQEVVGSIPTTPTDMDMQLRPVERPLDKRLVVGSNPTMSTGDGNVSPQVSRRLLLAA